MVTSVRIGDHDLEYVRLQPQQPHAGRPAIVLLHEGLGSVAMWRDFPQRLADATGAEVVVYSRAGYGQSSPAQLPRAVGYMHDEGLQVLPALLQALDLQAPLLMGHSDGGSIALLCAGGGVADLAGVVVMAPHVMVEDVSVRSIAQAKEAYQSTDLAQRLGRYHADVDAVFWGWNDIWLHEDFRSWNIEAYLPHIQVPVLAIQGHLDEYGTMEQIDRIAAQAPDVRLLKLDQCGHSAHKDQPEAVLAAVVAFLDALPARAGGAA